ncbi:sensor histidine kinase [Bifidobacterium sp. ESL0800]|uniref:sensor histidine kinase n=1 Tax=Bifidobacterium sp. ESL0800 TaxID=2983236 RepID=UPI0023F99AA3|nr:sensor histidine kinase [Bifidobacterium sp. ESL0800]WEV76345.1 sensor histidine kinase [Bifidobacterium sp. ESL0800]
MSNNTKAKSTATQSQHSLPVKPASSRFRAMLSAPAREFPRYSMLIFALGFVFQFPDSAYMGRRLLLWVQPTLALLLYVAMLKAPRLVWQRVAALALIAVCIWASPFMRHGGQLLTYVVEAEASLLFGPLFGYVAIAVSAPLMWALTPILNDLSGNHSMYFLVMALYILLAGILFMVYTTQSTKLQRANAQLAHDVETIESLTLSRERASMASEMHDSIGQRLTAMHYAHESALNAAAATENLTDEERAKINKPIARADAIAKDALSEVRQMARALDPSALGQTLTNDSIEAMAHSFADAGLDMHTDIIGSVNLLDADIQTLVFRAMQETLTNAVRHAHATKVNLTLIVSGEETTLSVEDDGPGIDVDDIDHGFGLSALEKRARQAGGTLILGESQELGGASVTLTVPLTGDAEAERTAHK